jgi:hypothetical protein
MKAMNENAIQEGEDRESAPRRQLLLHADDVTAGISPIFCIAASAADVVVHLVLLSLFCFFSLFSSATKYSPQLSSHFACCFIGQHFTSCHHHEMDFFLLFLYSYFT